VKCIYIDPPYNTGNENWVYNDNVNSPEIRKWLHQTVGKEAEDLTRHDKWLCMMYPRLALLREFLREDGAIFVSIDDNEVHHLRSLMDEVFGARNFVCSFIWEKKHTRANDARFVSDNHDFLLLYARSLGTLAVNRLPRTEAADARFKNPDNDARGHWISEPLQVKTPAQAYIYEITTPSGRRISPPVGRSWAFGKERYLELVKENRIYFGPDGKNVPRFKKFRDEVRDLVPVTIWPRKEVGDNQEAKTELKAILGENGISFDSPKPVRLMRRVLELSTDDKSLVMDSFSGSGTTGQAVFDTNLSGGGSRRFILIEMDEAVCRNVAALRLRSVIERHVTAQRESKRETGGAPAQDAGCGFRYCMLGTPLFDESGNIGGSVTFPDLAAHVFFIETGVPIPKRATGKSPLLGIHQGKAVYLLFNGVMGDKRANGGNVLTNAVLAKLPPHDGPKVVYGEACRLSAERLAREGVVFRQIPYEIKVT